MFKDYDLLFAVRFCLVEIAVCGVLIFCIGMFERFEYPFLSDALVEQIQPNDKIATVVAFDNYLSHATGRMQFFHYLLAVTMFVSSICGCFVFGAGKRRGNIEGKTARNSPGNRG